MRPTYQPTPLEVTKARRELAKAPPLKWTPARAAAVRRAKAILDCAAGAPDAWLYSEFLNPPKAFPAAEKARKLFHEVQAFLDAEYPERLEREQAEKAAHEAKIAAYIAADKAKRDARAA